MVENIEHRPLQEPRLYNADHRESPISPDDPPWSTWTGAAVWASSVALILILPSIFLAVYALAIGFTFENNEALMQFATRDPNAIIAQISAIFPAHLLTLAIAWAAVTHFGRRPFFETLGWDWGSLRWWHYIALLFGFLVITAIASTVFPIKEDDMERIVRSSRTALYLIAAMAVITAPIVEEVVYRGLLYSPLRRRFGMAAAVGLVTLLFTAVHVPQYYENPAKIIVLTVLSLSLTLIRAFSVSLLPCVVLHIAINGFNAALLIAEPYLQPHIVDPAQAVFILPDILK
jgi:uncharacterized protein